MRNFYFVFIIFFLCACSQKEEKIEAEAISNFYKNETQLIISVNYINQKYSGLQREYIKVIPSDSSWIRKNIFYDSNLKKLLNNSDINLVSFTSNLSCGDSIVQDIYFEVASKSQRKYYYKYWPCNTNVISNYESKNYKIIILNSRWVLDIEKN